MDERKKEMAELADRFMAAAASGDEATVRALLAADFKLWTSAYQSGGELGVDELVAGIKWEAENVKLEFTDVRRQYSDEGFVQQRVVRGKGPKGNEFAMPTCLVATVLDGKITRMDEYVIMPAPKTA